MKNILRIEYKRAVHSIGMLAALIMGIGCVLYQTISVIHKLSIGNAYLESSGAYASFTRGGFYNLWLPSYFDGTTIYFFYFIGIVVALPYGISYYSDKKSGLIKNICNRVGKRKYLNAKYMATFITGGIAAVVPLIIDFLIVRIILPIDCFEDVYGTILGASTVYGVFILKHPYLAAVVILAAWFIFAGALSTMCLMVSSISNNFFTIQLTPFFLMMILFYMPTFFPGKYVQYFPFYFLSVFGNWNPVVCIVESLIIVMITYGVFVIGESRRDTL